MANDLRFALRLMRKSPAFFITAALSLALGIGATTTVFSAFRAVFLRPLPYTDPGRLVEIRKPSNDGRPDTTTVTDVAFLRQFSHSFESIGVHGFLRAMTMTGGSEPVNIVTTVVEKDLFPTLRPRAQLGRVFAASDFEEANPRGILLSNLAWQRDFQSDPAAVGRQVKLDNDTYTIIGVMPREFQFPSSFPNAWIANRDGAIDPRTTARGIVARLKPGVTARSAQAELERMRPALARQYPESKRNFHIEVAQLGERDTVRYRSAFLTLCGAVGLLMLIACLNVANLVVARSVAREGEFAVRSALGANRGRLVRQVLVESLVLASVGGAIGLMLAWAGDRALLASLPPHHQIARLGETRLDAEALGFSVLLSFLTAVLFGISPAAVLSRFSMREIGRTATQSARRVFWRNGLVAGEVALSLVLLIGAGLLIRSFITLANVDPGFRRDHVLTMMMPAGAEFSKDKAALERRFTGILGTARAIPGVVSAGVATAVPMGTINISLNIELPEHPGVAISNDFKSISPGYLTTMGIPLRRGRMFTDRDDGKAPHVAIVNETFVRKYWPGIDPIGRRMGTDITVVGVVGDTRDEQLGVAAAPEFYQPYTQYIGPSLGAMLVVRTQDNPAALASSLRAAIHSAFPGQPVSDIATMETRVADSMAEPRLYSLLLAMFAAVALALTGVGVYGVVSYAVNHRTREFGIRMALGAQSSDVLAHVMRGGLGTVLLGCACGIGGAWLLRTWVASLLYGIGPADPIAFTVAPALLLMIAAAACYIPARRGTSIDPNVALRTE
ncbi:MAG TPA: ABC transporter permease [Bryobacteraceae bacterium]|nr:ABC transporter permease [Bryobacteraceae bacterium]